MRTPIVRGGKDDFFINGAHTFAPVYVEMMLQIYRDYNSLPLPEKIKAHEIRFFYNGLRAELKRHTGKG